MECGASTSYVEGYDAVERGRSCQLASVRWLLPSAVAVCGWSGGDPRDSLQTGAVIASALLSTDEGMEGGTSYRSADRYNVSKQRPNLM